LSEIEIRFQNQVSQYTLFFMWVKLIADLPMQDENPFGLEGLLGHVTAKGEN
jgi:hypothetical protein